MKQTMTKGRAIDTLLSILSAHPIKHQMAGTHSDEIMLTFPCGTKFLLKLELIDDSDCEEEEVIIGEEKIREIQELIETVEGCLDELKGLLR
jgi:hypothetical protein